MPSNKLTVKAVEAAKVGRRYGDGRGLWLIVSPTGAKRWAYRFTIKGKVSETGLGSYPEVSLGEAREKAVDKRKLAKAGKSPVEAKREAAHLEAIQKKKPTFGECADTYIQTHSPSWKNPIHRKQWEMTLKTYAAPLRGKQVDKITVFDVLEVLRPMLETAPSTAYRLRNRIELILDAAKAQGFRTGENPAAWRGNLKHLMPKPPKQKHYSSLSYSDLPAFIAELRNYESINALALEFLILTASRPTEALAAEWKEIEIKEKLWKIPPERMKPGVWHRVPLSARAIEILEKLLLVRQGDYVFSGRDPKRPLNRVMPWKQLKAMGKEVTSHGFRSTFRDWAGDETPFQREVAEMSISHTVKGVEAAYRRSDALEKRRALMDAWAQYCEPKSVDNVLSFKKPSA